MIIIVDYNGKVVKSLKFKTEADKSFASWVARVNQNYTALLKRARLQTEDIVWIGLASPGPMTLADGILGDNVANLNGKGWASAAIRDALSKALKKPVRLANDVNSAAWGEYWVGKGKNSSSILAALLGTGLGIGNVSMGVLYEGSSGNGFEGGHIVVDPQGTLPCGCGEWGCVESIVGKDRLIKLGQDIVDLGWESNLGKRWNKKGIDRIKLIEDLWRAKDRACTQLMEKQAFWLSRAIISQVRLADPEILVLGGGRIPKNGIFYRHLSRLIKAEAWSVHKRMKIVPASDGNIAAIGAAGLARESFLATG